MLDRRSYLRLKRLIDIAGAGTGLVVAAPVMGATAVAVRARLGRPVLFRQQRPGLHGRPFEMVKFRTMLLPEQVSGQTDDAVRLTPFGAWLRSTSLDELPALWNVLRGDMSLVGPRPLLMEYLPLYSPEQARRHDARPGLTGLAQVRGRNAQTWDHRLSLDSQYVRDLSAMLDLRILADTVVAVVSRRGVSAPGEATMPRFRGSVRTEAAS